MSKYLDPKADIVFKKIFGEHPHLLKSFLNAILPLPEDQPIVELKYLSNEQIPVIPTFKRTIVDVKCTDSSGRVFIVEMQIDWTDSFKQRLLFGASQAIVKQLEKGESYQLFQPVYGVGIIADIFDRDTNEWYHHYQLVKRNTEDIIEHLQLVFIELPKFPAQSTDEKKLRILWLRFLREIHEKTVQVAKDLLDVPEIHEAVVLAEEVAYDNDELYSYQSYWDSVRTYKTLLIGKYEDGLAKGKAEGKAEGKVEGIREVARNLLKSGMDESAVARVTNLTLDEIKLLLNSQASYY